MIIMYGLKNMQALRSSVTNLKNMCAIKALFDFYIKASLHVALSATALTGVTMLSKQIHWNTQLLIFVFCSTVVCYNFIKYGTETNKYLSGTDIHYKYIHGLSVISLCFALHSLSRLSWEIWGTVIILGTFSFLYAVPLFPHTRNLRHWRGFKIYIVALVWTGVTVGLPLIATQHAMSWDLWMLGLRRFILIIVLLLPFEIRDLSLDDPQIKTLPQVLGVRTTQKLGVVLSLIFFGLALLDCKFTPSEVLIHAVLSVILAIVCLLARRRQSRYFASFWVEGIPIGWLSPWIYITLLP